MPDANPLPTESRVSIALEKVLMIISVVRAVACIGRQESRRWDGGVLPWAPLHSLGRAASLMFHVVTIWKIHRTYCRIGLARDGEPPATARNQRASALAADVAAMGHADWYFGTGRPLPGRFLDACTRPCP